MSTPTPELGLQQAVDADDTADYLTINLSSSLKTVDSLFNNVSGHTHAGVHQGGPISSNSLAGAVDIQDWYRSTGHTSAFPTSGQGIELYYEPTVGGVLQGFNRATGAYLPVAVAGSSIEMEIGGLGSMLNVNPDGTVSTAKTFTSEADLNVTGNSHLTGQLVVGGPSQLQTTTITGTLGVNGAAVVSGALSANGITNANLDIGDVRTYYGINNTLYLTNDGTTWTFHGPVVHDTTVTMNGVLNASSIVIANGGTIQGGGGGYTRMDSLTVTPGPFAAASTTINGTLVVNGTTTHNGQVNATSDITTSGGNFSAPGGSMGLGIAPATGGYRLALANVANATGQGAAQAWVTWSSVEHARTYGVSVQSVDDPLGKLRAIPVYYYDHLSMDTASDTPIQNAAGSMDASMTYGMSAAEVGAVVPELVGESNVDYGRLMTILWAACQEIDARLTAVEGAAA